jgi:hypothetical protein
MTANTADWIRSRLMPAMERDIGLIASLISCANKFGFDVDSLDMVTYRQCFIVEGKLNCIA